MDVEKGHFMALKLELYHFFIVFGILSIAFWSSKPASRKKFAEYVQVISGMAIFITLMGLVLQIRRDNTQDEITYRTGFIERSYNSFSQLEQDMWESYPYGNKLYNEMNALPSLDIQGLDAKKEEAAERTFSSRAFLIIEGVFLALQPDAGAWDKPEGQELLRLWRRWFSSPILLREWNDNADIYSSDVREFVENNILPYATR